MKVLVIGGAGFIGSNTAGRFLKKGHEVWVFDNLSRRGTEWNINKLKENKKLKFVKGDTRRYDELKKLFSANRDFDAVYHLAAQVAVTTSVINPREDFEINALGTFNVLEAVRETKSNPVIVYS